MKTSKGGLRSNMEQDNMELEYSYDDAMFLFKKAAKEVDKKNNTHLLELLNIMEDIHDRVADIDEEVYE